MDTPGELSDWEVESGRIVMMGGLGSVVEGVRAQGVLSTYLTVVRIY